MTVVEFDFFKHRNGALGTLKLSLGLFKRLGGGFEKGILSSFADLIF
jgi:hypothetical protein